MSPAVVVAVLVLGACGSDVGAGTVADDGSPAGGEARPGVAIVGDSITERGAPVLREELGDDWSLAIDGASGFRAGQQVPAAEALAAAAPEQVVVNLGTNDVLQHQSTDAALDDLRHIVELFPDAACVHLVTINEAMALVPGDLATPAAAINAGIRAMALDDPRVDVVDWAGAVSGDEADLHGEALVRDTVHPSARGDRVLASMYADALAACDR